MTGDWRLAGETDVVQVLNKMRRFDVHNTSVGQSIPPESLPTPQLTPSESGTQSPITASLPSTSDMTMHAFNFEQARPDPSRKMNSEVSGRIG